LIEPLVLQGFRRDLEYVKIYLMVLDGKAKSRL